MSGADRDSKRQQRDTFLAAEGNQWFVRNDNSTIADHTRGALDLLAQFVTAGARVLEIGCAAAANLAYLREARPGIECHGIEPSAAAVAAARSRYPFVHVQVGSADVLPYEAQSFDVVYFGFCLYLVDRELLFTAVAEADRVLKDRGILGIIDFDPRGPRKRQYRHLPGLYSYKMDYSRMFLASDHYHLAAKASYSHFGRSFHSDSGERVATTVLYKDIAAAYLPEDDSADGK